MKIAFSKIPQFLSSKYEIKCPYSFQNENIFTCDNEIEWNFHVFYHISAYHDFWILVVKHPVCVKMESRLKVCERSFHKKDIEIVFIFTFDPLGKHFLFQKYANSITTFDGSMIKTAIPGQIYWGNSKVGRFSPISPEFTVRNLMSFGWTLWAGHAILNCKKTYSIDFLIF